jgi:hypothetical protein
MELPTSHNRPSEGSRNFPAGSPSYGRVNETSEPDLHGAITLHGQF